ncbi:cAMP-dependent protein kinase catalytic subunit 1-like [Diachasma alloeum]|uniref:cAMP-dependent protein kinase catalytic subunit 1-like n=1 Tax=Diachasma alloeum TaxID=454923 RepID=UPI0007384A79|nr:cAMP-dependent protein kinase catalytic subunit 1-like [Diachasma alloeum]
MRSSARANGSPKSGGNSRGPGSLSVRKPSFCEYQAILDGLKVSFNKRWKASKHKKGNEAFDDFERVRTLGTGAFGRVLLVKYKPTSQYYAMKTLEKEKIVKMKQVEHTLNEKKVLYAIKYPFVVSMEFFFMDNSFIYIVLPFINGGEMFSHLRKMGKFDEKLSQFYAAQVAMALEYLHYCGLVYRDLKPENILLDQDGYLKLTDFGFCKMIEGRTWTLCGTPEYLAPEIILSKGYGKSCDWWSYGILIYEMNAGYAPFYSHDPMRIYEKIVSGKFKCPSHFSDDLRDILRNILQVDLTRRYGNLKDGPLDIKRHLWFRDISWDQIYNRKVEPSHVPKCKNAGDDSNFDRYDEEEIVVGSEDRYAEEFADF